MCFICGNHNIIHGANYEKLYAALNITMPERVIDFSTNTNIISWPKINLDVERLASSYPDYECSRLVKIISERENIYTSRNTLLRNKALYHAKYDTAYGCGCQYFFTIGNFTY